MIPHSTLSGIPGPSFEENVDRTWTLKEVISSVSQESSDLSGASQHFGGRGMLLEATFPPVSAWAAARGRGLLNLILFSTARPGQY